MTTLAGVILLIGRIGFSGLFAFSAALSLFALFAAVGNIAFAVTGAAISLR